MGNPRPKSEVYSPKIPLGKEVESKAGVSMDSKTAGIKSAAGSSSMTSTSINKPLIEGRNILFNIIKHSRYLFAQKPSVGVLENEDDIELGEGLTVRQVYGETISGFDPKVELMFLQQKQRILAEDNSGEIQAEISAAEKELEENKARLEKSILDLKINTSIEISFVRVYNDALANSLCAKYGMKALICSKGILLANGQEQNIPLLCEALKKLGKNFSNFIMKGQGTWYLHYTKIPELLPIFKLVADSKKKLLDNFNEGDFFYKWGTSLLQTFTQSLKKADKLEDVFQTILAAAIKDSEKCYVPFGEGPEGKKAFKNVFGVNYDANAIAVAANEAKKIIYLAEPIDTFIEHGTPDWNTFWRGNDHLQEEMEIRNGYLHEMLEKMGKYREYISIYTSKAVQISKNRNPREYDTWKEGYNYIYDGLDKEKVQIESNAKKKLKEAYGEYGEFYYNIINEIIGSKVAAFAIEALVGYATGGGSGLAVKKIGSIVIKQGAKKIAEGTAKQGAKKVGNFLLRETMDNTLSTGVANLDGFSGLGGREISGREFILSVALGTGTSAISGALGKAGKKVIAKELTPTQAMTPIQERTGIIDSIIADSDIQKEVKTIIAKGPLVGFGKEQLTHLLNNPKQLRQYIRIFVPEKKKKKFLDFFIRLSITENGKEMIEMMLKNPTIYKMVTQRIRDSGGFHEWLMTKNFKDFLTNQKWNKDGPFLAMALTRLVQKTKNVNFKAGGGHPSVGRYNSSVSEQFHDGLSDVIDNCNTKGELFMEVKKYAKDYLDNDSYDEFSHIFMDTFRPAPMLSLPYISE